MLYYLAVLRRIWLKILILQKKQLPQCADNCFLIVVCYTKLVFKCEKLLEVKKRPVQFVLHGTNTFL